MMYRRKIRIGVKSDVLIMKFCLVCHFIDYYVLCCENVTYLVFTKFVKMARK